MMTIKTSAASARPVLSISSCMMTPRSRRVVHAEVMNNPGWATSRATTDCARLGVEAQASSLCLQHGEHGGRVDAAAKAEDAGALGELRAAAIARGVDAEDHAAEPGSAQAAQLLLQVARGPEAHDLEERHARGIAPALQREVGKDGRTVGLDWGGSRRTSQSGARRAKSRAKRASSLLLKRRGGAAGKMGAPERTCSVRLSPPIVHSALSSKRSHQHTTWDGLNPEQCMTRLDKDMSPSPAFVPAVCGALYAYMVDIGGIDRVRGAHLASALASCAGGAIEEQLGNRAQRRCSSQKARRDRRAMS